MEIEEVDSANHLLDELVTKYKEKLDKYISTVKQARLSGVPESEEYVGHAIDFLTGPFPEIPDCEIHTFCTPDQPASSASNSCANAALAPPVHLQRQRSLRHVREVPATAPNDKFDPKITDIKILPNGLIVVADENNRCIKLFSPSQQGRLVDNQPLVQCPSKIAVMGANLAGPVWKIAVTVKGTQGILILAVTQTGFIKHQQVIKTKGECQTVAGFNSSTLAIGYKNVPGVDLINLTGKVVRKLSPEIRPSCITAPGDNCGLVVTYKNELHRLKVLDGKENWFNFEVPVSQIKNLGDIAWTTDGVLVVDKIMRTLHLLSGCGEYQGQLWRHPCGNDVSDQLDSVSAHDEVFACSTKKGPIYVLQDLV